MSHDGAAYTNIPQAEPEIASKGRAWSLPIDEELYPAYCAVWLVDAEGFSHPYWWWYTIQVIHLREMDGVPPPHLYFPEATHEVIFAALEPNKPLPDLNDNKSKYSLLQPADVVQQFTARSDKQAVEVVRMCVLHICDGQSPDQDYRSYWEDCITNTAEHLMYGGHPIDN